MLTRVDHIDVRTPDFPGTVEFLKTMGMQEVRRTDPKRASVELSFPGETQVVLEVRHDPSAEKTYIHHVAFHSDAGAGDVESLQSAGIDFSKTLAFIEHTGRTISNAHDPGRATWQLTD
ncbi:hypothetical protein BH11ACT6_BH11ACT6_22760 [soil metagenome]